MRPILHTGSQHHTQRVHPTTMHQLTHVQTMQDVRSCLAEIAHSLQVVFSCTETLLRLSIDPASPIANDIRRIKRATRQMSVSLNRYLDIRNFCQTKQFDTPNNFSHDLRTPVNAIIGFSEMLLEDDKNNGLPYETEAGLNEIFACRA